MEPRPLSAHPGIRALAVVAAVAGFLAVASVLNPSSSTASGLGGDPDEAPLLSLGRLHSDRYTIELFAGPDGLPRYTVIDADGTELAYQVPAEELRYVDPDLDPESWVAIPHAEVDPGDDF